MFQISAAQTKIALRQFRHLLLQDAELEQALIRCAILFLIALYLWIPSKTDPFLPFTLGFSVLVYLSVSLPTFLWIAAKPGQFTGRKMFFVILDQIMVAYAVSFGGNAIPVIAVAFWVIVGSGFRFGNHYLYLSTMTAVAGILYNIFFSPTWADYSFYGWSYLISILVVSIYTTALIKRVTDTNVKLAESLNHASTLVRTDSLTGLHNRFALTERLTSSIAMTKRQHTYLALLYFDLDGFKAVNDTFGHKRGDELLKEVAQRVTTKIRATDTFARLGGDEFIIILENVHIPQDAILIATKVLDTLRGMMVGGTDLVTGALSTLRISASIGISSYGPNTEADTPSVDKLIKQADGAMYQAKQAGKGSYRLYQPTPNILDKPFSTAPATSKGN